MENNPLAGTLAMIERTRLVAQQREAEAPPALAPVPARSGAQLELPITFGWAVPNFCLRSSVFPAAARAKRPGGLLVALGTLRVSVGANDLTQSDADLFYYSLNRCDSGGVARFSSADLLRALGISTGGNNQRWAENRLRAMVGVTLDVSQPHRGRVLRFTKPLLRGVASDPFRGLIVEIDPLIGAFFAKGGAWSSLDFVARQKLRGKPLAQWLHGFFISHTGPHICKVAQLRDLAGVSGKSKNFALGLRRSLDAVAEAVKFSGYSFKWTVARGVVLAEVVRPPPAAARVFRALKKSAALKIS